MASRKSASRGSGKERKLKLFVAASLDGYIAGPNGEVSFLDPYMGEDHGIKEFLTSVDTVLIGRKTHDFMVQHGMPSYTGMKNFVFSRSKRAAVEGVEFVTGDVATLVKRIREKSGKDLWLVGGGELTREALASKALDEVIVGLIPVLLGKGIPLFPAGYPECKLELLHCGQFSKGVVQLSYRCRYS